MEGERNAPNVLHGKVLDDCACSVSDEGLVDGVEGVCVEDVD